MEKSTWSNLLQLLLSCHQGDTERRTSLALQEGGKGWGRIEMGDGGNRQREDKKSPLCPYRHIRVHNTYTHVCVHINTDLDAQQTSWLRVYLLFCYWQKLLLPLPEQLEKKKSILLFHAMLYKMPVHRLMKKMHEFG